MTITESVAFKKSLLDRAAAVAVGSFIRSEGRDLLQGRTEALSRGTPVWADSGANVEDVQRTMAAQHVRVVVILQGQELIGTVDLVDLATSVEPVRVRSTKGRAYKPPVPRMLLLGEGTQR